MHEIRQEKMNSFIQEQEVASIKQLQALFPEISLMTIHRDLDVLAQAGFITKVRGGARSVQHTRDLAFGVRAKENLTGKAQVAEKAAKLVGEASCIFLDSGTTCLALAYLLPDAPINVITTGPNIATALAHVAGPAVTMCPGHLNKENLTVSGHSTLHFLETLNIDLAFIGVSGYGKDEGFTCGKENEMVVKRQIIKQARKIVVLCDQTKFHRRMPFTFAKLEDIDVVVSDTILPEDFLQMAQAAGTVVL